MSIYYPEGCDQDVAQEAIRTLARVINKMHQHGVMHRRIDTDVVGMKISTSNESITAASYKFKVDKLGGLYLAFSLGPDQKVF